MAEAPQKCCSVLCNESYQEACDVNCSITGGVNFDHFVKVVPAMLPHHKVTVFLFVLNKLSCVGGIMRLLSCCSLNFHPWVLSSIDDFSLNQLLLWWLLNCFFLIPSFFLHFFVCFFYSVSFFFFFFFFFLGPRLWHMEVPRLGFWAVSVTCTRAHRNTGSLTHWVRSGIEPITSWFLVGFISSAPWWELLFTVF